MNIIAAVYQKQRLNLDLCIFVNKVVVAAFLNIHLL